MINPLEISLGCPCQNNLGVVSATTLATTSVAVLQKVNAIRASVKQSVQAVQDYDNANIQLRQIIAEVDAQIAKYQQLNGWRDVQDKLNNWRTGIQESINQWGSKTFTPDVYYGQQLTNSQAEYERLLAELGQKEEVLKQLSGQKTLRKVILVGGILAVTATTFYFLNKKYKWI